MVSKNKNKGLSLARVRAIHHTRNLKIRRENFNQGKNYWKAVAIQNVLRRNNLTKNNKESILHLLYMVPTSERIQFISRLPKNQLLNYLKRFHLEIPL